jgi:hypothetical protein
LGQIETAVKKGTLGEFAGFGKACATLEAKREDLAGREDAAMAINLD